MRTRHGIFLPGLVLMSLVLLVAIADARGQAGFCTSNADCDDHNICTRDFCDTVPNPNRCVYVSNVGLPCQPENHCYGAGACEGAVCVPQGPLLTCDDENPCTVDGCEYSTGCTHLGETCDDGNACTRDTCTLPDICSHDQPTDCDDDDACTQDSCDPSSGCIHLRTNCDDDNPCTLDRCTLSGACAHDPVDCNDGDPCTRDECSAPTGQCTHTEQGPCAQDPKTVGYWQRVCRGNGNYSDTVTEADARFIQANNFCFPIPVDSPADVCEILLLDGVERCLHAKQEFIALALNLNHGRVFLFDRIDSNCTDNTIVEQSFAEARHGICLHPCLTEPCFAGGDNTDCALAECECKEINQGRALHVHALAVSKIADGAVRLSWIAAVGDADDLASTPRRYRVWRGSDASGPFLEIAEVADTVFDDTAADGERLVYEVTPVW